MPNRKITAFASAASAQASTLYPVVSGGNTNKKITQHTMLQTLGIAQYVEATCRATTTVANLPLSSIFDIYVKALVGSSANDGGSNIEIGTGTQSNAYAVVRTSAVGYYNPRSVDFGVTITQTASGAVVAAAPTATAGASFIVGIGYFR